MGFLKTFFSQKFFSICFRVLWQITENFISIFPFLNLNDTGHIAGSFQKIGKNILTNDLAFDFPKI